MTFARHLTGVAWSKFALVCYTDKTVVHDDICLTFDWCSLG